MKNKPKGTPTSQMKGYIMDKVIFSNVPNYQTAFEYKFAVDENSGSYKMKADAMPLRFKTSRDSQHLTKTENRVRNQEIWNRADKEDNQLNNKLADYIAIGYRLRENETVSEFVARVEEFIMQF